MTRDEFYQLLDQHAGPGVIFDLMMKDNPERVALEVHAVKGEPDWPGTFTYHDIVAVDMVKPNMEWIDVLIRYDEWLHDWRRERTDIMIGHQFWECDRLIED